MPIPLLIPLISAGVSAVSGAAQRKKQGERVGRQTAWSPWTGLTPEKRQEGSAINDLLKGGGAGLKLSEGINKMQNPADPGLAGIDKIYSKDPTAGTSMGGKFNPANGNWAAQLLRGLGG